MRDAPAIRATVSIISSCGRSSAHIERTAKYRERRSVDISVEGKHLLVERYQLWRRLIPRPSDRIGPTQRKLLQDVILKCRGWNSSRRDDGQCNPNPLAIKEEEQFVVDNRPAYATPEVVYRRSRVVTSWGGI